ncbi:hypothetical protein [Streptomyces sp. NPDC096132]|uniref:hypothetical protein n=1 Tax=Streptomyces sp. NPDC096132 TaxID=3366075 RepID=UPI00382CED2F
MAVPPGHAAMLELYGPGCFNDFLWINEDGCANVWLDIQTCSRRASEMLSRKKIPELRSVLAGFGATPADVIQWGSTDNADSLFWIPSGAPDEWPTVIVEAGQLRLLLIEKPSPDVVRGLLDRTLNCPFFPSEFWEPVPVFERWQSGKEG